MGAFVHEATYTFAYESTATATLVERSVRPEIGDIEDDRSTVALTREEATLKVAVEAADLVALRAASNTWLTLVDVAESSAGCGQPTPG